LVYARLGVKSAGLHEVYSPSISQALKSALQQFEQKLPGFVSDAGLLHGVETRTSSPVCCAALRCAALRCAALCCGVLRCAVLRCAVLRCAVLCCAVLCCIQTANKQTFHNQNRASRHGSCSPFVALITENWHADQASVVLAWTGVVLHAAHFQGLPLCCVLLAGPHRQRC